MLPLPGQKYRHVRMSAFCRVRHVDVVNKRVHVVTDDGGRESINLDAFNAEWRYCIPVGRRV